MPRIWRLLVLVVWAVFCAGDVPALADPPPVIASGTMGKASCLQCHRQYMKETVHARLAPKAPGVANLECEACHGPGETHVTGEAKKGTIRREPSTKLVKDLCAACHPKDRALSAAWKRDAHHQDPDLSCLSCHDIHFNKEFAQLRKPQKELCLSCHADIGAQLARPFHHPVADGQLACASCHDPHQIDRVSGRPGGNNDRCLSCHTEVKGPFLWEHKALTDDAGCLNCHQAHGGSSRKLLKQSDNQLCLQCHQDLLTIPGLTPGAGGRSQATIEHARLPVLQNQCASCHGSPFTPLVGNHTGKVSPGQCSICHATVRKVDHTRFLTEGRCLDCHTDIHGSNHSREFLD